MLTESLPRVSIGHLPTPLEHLPRLTAQMGGPELWIKRDDQTGLATGGNKTRKLEFLVADYVGGGYGVMGDLERAAIGTLAQSEGILLDPVYTGRAFGGLLDLVQRGAFESGDRVLFWHTGGTPALFAYAEALMI